MRRRQNLAIRAITVVVVLGALLLSGVAAGAAIDGPCRGTVTIDGIVYSEANDSASNPIVIPDEEGLIAFWEGSTNEPITDHTGEIGVVVGPTTINFADWGGDNAALKTDSNGSYAIDDARDVLPISVVGLYKVSGFHRGEGGSCDGSVMVLLEGNPLTTPVGAGAAAGTILAGLGVLSAGRRRI
ncbi:MAG: hypothetical protein OEX97_03055 [Acidimicrobiia bacterium]|nr:hypothetical protein [Acidimicrobiia bacterium]